MSSILQWKGEFILAEKSVFYCKKGGSFWTEISVFYSEKGVILSWKVSVLPQNRESFSNWRTGMGIIFSSDWGSRDVNQVGHLSKTPLNLLEIHEIGPVDTSESKQQNYNQIWHM